MPTHGPRSAVFTTMLIDEQGHAADWPRHFARLQQHAKRLRIQLPNHPPTVASTESTRCLVRVGYTSGADDWLVEFRPITVRNESIDAITVEAPRWNTRTNGTKHGEWKPYLDARQAAERMGCDAALLVSDFSIVDGDRATPMVLDEDGTVWIPHEREGGVTGITAALLEEKLPAQGMPVVRGKLNERMVARCMELVLVGTGMGVCKVETLDGEPLGTSAVLSKACQQVLHQHFTEGSTWSAVGQQRV